MLSWDAVIPEQSIRPGISGMQKQLWKSEIKKLTEDRKFATYFGNGTEDSEGTVMDENLDIDFNIHNKQTNIPSCTNVVGMVEGIVGASDADAADVMKEVEEEFPLNLKQKKVFQLIVSNTIKRLNGKPVNQVLVYVGGAGGTGKTQIIKAVVKFLTNMKQRHTLRLCAYTDTAATLIGGNTICSLAAIRKSTITKLKKIWAGVTTLLVDETSEM